ncbi:MULTISPECIES: chromosome segregation protein SMC [Lactobacillus]|uniref:Chromosome partition protein Smc n=1 Tax=Lactobacillus xujianguonis TaxID=2495899 RepID=A0A437SXI2_9LACO|nr:MULTISPECIES: chromosome segregation protein SMC [Lactobacillus]RVU71631.1 chromosome segregation protein SMC [Lactobacillus xujianguonis]
MPLTELIIDGFKSFADKTTIHFGDGITGIVGPNGSGKSNVTEAIRWAMGESRAKSLRGNNMRDVIFAGSEFRKPLNRAEVTLVFDNKKRDLHFDSDQVAVTRRILRSGDNEYLINHQNVRQKDVRELFLDSGISQNSLAIISQGRVDQILNSRPEQRREIFEEAAGVLHFKQQKEEAQAQLEKTNDNLIRINDLVKELEGRVEPLHEQSSLAKEYQFQKAGLDQKLKTLLAFEIQTLNEQKLAMQKEANDNQSLLSKLDQEVKSSQASVTEKRAEYQALREKREEIQSQLLQLTEKLSKINADLQMTEQSKQFDEATKNEYRKQVADLKEAIAEIEKDLARQDKSRQELTAQQNQLKAQRAKLVGTLKANPEDLNHQLDEKRNDYIQLLQDQTSNNNQIVYLQSELKRINDDTSYHNDDVAEQLDKAKAELATLQTQGQKLKVLRKQKEADYTAKEQEAQQLEEQLQALRQTVAAERNQLQKISARHEALVNIQKRHEGYYFGVRNVLNHLADYPGVIGAVGELITFPAELEAAMTTALGGGVQNLVTKTKTSARDAINKLKQNHAGRATFLPLDGLRQYTIPRSTVTTLQSFAGFKGVASELVTSNTDVDLTPAINYLLGSVIIVDTIETAMKVAQRVGRYRIVTLDGDVISPGGSMTGGVKNLRNNSPLQTTAEINQLQGKILSLQKQFKADQASLGKISDEADQAKQELANLQTDLQAATQELNEAALSYQSQEKEVNRLADASALYNSRLRERDDRIADLEAQIKAAKDKQNSLADQASDFKQAMATMEDRIKNFTSLNKKVQAEVADLVPQIAVFANKLENLANQRHERQTQLKNDLAQLDQLTHKLQTLSDNGETSQKQKTQLEADRQTIAQQQKDLQQQLNDLSAKLGQFDAKINQLEQVASRNYDLRKDAAEEQKNYSVQIAKFDSKMDQKLETLREDYALTYEAALNKATIDNTEENRNKLKKAVKLHRMSIEDIGPVNLDAIEEYENVKKRYDFLNGQQNDLLKARTNLEKSMDELDKEVRSRFETTFKQVSEHFTKIFPVVFGGGSAKLVLTDPDDMLTTGVEMIAQPPGKKLQRLSLLSGGERALTAITLLFAMLEVNPVPFCIFDEVEAALDDANVARFARFLQKYDLHTQFIVITHRRGTMEQADQLFGLVMQESGVSQILSVSLKDIKNEVEA